MLKFFNSIIDTIIEVRRIKAEHTAAEYLKGH